jgi:inhibitor of KinA
LSNSLTIEPLGDCALLIRGLTAPAHELASWLNDRKPKGLEEAVASYDTVGVYFDRNSFERQALEEAIDSYEPAELLVPRRHEIPVCYEMGSDLIDVATKLGLTPLQVVHLHCGKTYNCYAIGFCPGFPYLGYLADGLCGISRRPEPRLSVPRGSVAITGNQTGIYSLERAGGWALIGRTPLEIVNVDDSYFPIGAGDEIAFLPVSSDDYKHLEGNRL